MMSGIWEGYIFDEVQKVLGLGECIGKHTSANN